jgi:hypothetical protein
MVITRNLKEEIIEQLKTKELVRIPASEEEYFSVAYDISKLNTTKMKRLLWD